MIESKKPKETDGVVLIMSCDRYQPFWNGLYHYMQKHWDKSINWPIYFCSEEVPFKTSDPNWHSLCLGKCSYNELQQRALNYLVDYEYIFFMLEDFWPSRPMTSSMFYGLFDLMKCNDWDCLHIDTMRPELYKVIPTSFTYENQRVLQFSNQSDWFFNQQAGFWKRKLLSECKIDPTIPEHMVSTTLSFEMGCDRYLKEKHPEAKIMLYHYWWYPRAGVSWRGEFSLIGKEMDVQMHIDNWCEQNLDIYKKSPSDN